MPILLRVYNKNIGGIILESIEKILSDLIPSNAVWDKRHSLKDFDLICNRISEVRNRNSTILKAIYRGSPEAKNIPRKLKRQYLDFHEKFYNEILPLQKLLCRVFPTNENILIQYTGNTNKSYDAELFNILDKNYQQKIEITTIVDGESVPTFKEHMRYFGYAPGVPGMPGSIEPYKKEVGIEKQVAKAKYSAKHLSFLQELTKDTILKKKRDIYTGYWLIINFLDWECAFPDNTFDQPTEKYRRCFNSVIQRLELSSIFKKVFFIGSSCDYFEEIDLASV